MNSTYTLKVRKPAVAGKFYPASKEEIYKIISSALLKEGKKIDYSLSEKKIIGGIVPHAGYMFSIYEAIYFFEIIKNSNQKFDTIIILNPDHNGTGSSVTLDESDIWETPLGKVAIDKDFYSYLPFPVSRSVHQYEHSAEVMVPLLQYALAYSFRILPVSITKQNYLIASEIANQIVEANKILNKNILIIASSDFSHYVDPKEGARLDKKVIEKILHFQAKEVYTIIKQNNISVCGYAPIMSLMEYATFISSAPKAEVLRIGHSGEVVQSSEVVDYVAILFYCDELNF